jgi:hypothetical protein
MDTNTNTESNMSNTKHTPAIRLSAARRAYESALEACPHWDYETGHAEHGCCHELEEMRRELALARAAIAKAGAL